MANCPITVIGSYAVGMTMKTQRFPVGGETVLGYDFSMLHGGKGSNQAIAAARLGADVCYFGCVGKDRFGDQALSLFQEEKICATAVKQSSAFPTGVGFITVNAQGENQIVIDFGANNDICRGDIEAILPKIHQSRLLLLQLEINLDAVVFAAEKAWEAGVLVVLNPAPFQPISEGLLACCDYITPNETEARLLLGLSPTDPISNEEVAQRLLHAGAKTVVMTLGAKGALIAQSCGCTRVYGYKVEVVDSTGAGDTFSAALAVALGEGKDIIDAVEFANAAAALSVTKYGVIPSLPYRKAVDALMQGEKVCTKERF